jgi:transposase
MNTLPDLSTLSHHEKDMLIRALFQAVQDLTARCERLEREVQQLKASKPPKKTSRNSSSPPSTDQKTNHLAETQSQKRENSVGRSGGGRPLDPNPDAQITLRPATCQTCGVFLFDAIERTHAVYEKIELPEIKPVITRITQLECTCKHCGTRTVATAPVGLEPGSPYGMSIQSLLTTLRFQHAISYQRLSGVMNDVFHVSISEGAITTQTTPVSSWQSPNQTIAVAIPHPNAPVTLQTSLRHTNATRTTPKSVLARALSQCKAMLEI